MTYIQIGCNTGYDTFFELCKQNKPTKIILIEPHEQLHDSIKNCYADASYAEISYEAVAIVDDPTVEIVEMRSPTGLSQHSSVIPLKDWSTEIYAIVPATTVTKLIEKHNIDHIDLLYIDTEGNDARIINSLDLTKIKPNIIIYEAWNFVADHFVHESELNGVNGMNFIRTKLESYGYKVERTQMGDDDNYTATLT
jgi:FkbM family methyltransferase